MTYKDNLKTDLIILFKMNMNEAKNWIIFYDHITHLRQSDYVSFIFYLLP